MTVSPNSPSLNSIVPQPPLTVCINLQTLKTNFRRIRQFVPSTTKILPIIKADAYGHGAVPVAQALAPLDIFGFGVASVPEGIRLREQHIHTPIIITGPLLNDHIRDIIHYNLTPVISHPDILHILLTQLSAAKEPFPIHIKIDTGLHRLGFDAKEALALIPSLVSSATAVSLQGVLTHFADADNLDPSFTNQQLQQFQICIRRLQEQGLQIPLYHMANSAGILFHPASHLGMVRPGIMLYGYLPGYDIDPPPFQLQPVMEAKTYIAHLRSLEPGEVVGYNALFRTRRLSQIAVLPVGYTHGFPRHLTGTGHVLIHGTPAPIIGKICMDMMMVDITTIDCNEGDEIIIFNSQEMIQEIANNSETIPYETLTAISQRVKRLLKC